MSRREIFCSVLTAQIEPRNRKIFEKNLELANVTFLPFSQGNANTGKYCAVRCQNKSGVCDDGLQPVARTV